MLGRGGGGRCLRLWVTPKQTDWLWEGNMFVMPREEQRPNERRERQTRPYFGLFWLVSKRGRRGHQRRCVTQNAWGDNDKSSAGGAELGLMENGLRT